jgi:aromatic ring-cleaving dioxygenase
VSYLLDDAREEAARWRAKADDAAAEISALKAEVERLTALARFASAVLDQFFNDGEFGDLDGAWVQDKAVELGLLVHPETAHDPDDCEGCADEPRSCYVLAAAALAGEEGKP